MRADQDVYAFRALAGSSSNAYERVSARVLAREPVDALIAQPDDIERDDWIYAQLGRLLQDMGLWLIALRAECRADSSTCAALMIERDVYLCPAHGDERQCTALDYAAHVVDAAADTLQSERFPGGRVPQQSARLFGAICKQLVRVFLHVRAHHPDLCAVLEKQDALYARFYALCDTYELYPADALPPP